MVVKSSNDKPSRKDRAEVKAKAARKLRKTGMTLKEIADKLSISFASVQSYCTGMRNVDARTFRKHKGQYRGVSKVVRDGKKTQWQAILVLKNGKSHYIGLYPTAKIAAIAWNAVCAFHYGKKSPKLNKL
jgi:transcriptional regulator with XRE-family HTH domain